MISWSLFPVAFLGSGTRECQLSCCLQINNILHSKMGYAAMVREMERAYWPHCLLYLSKEGVDRTAILTVANVIIIFLRTYTHLKRHSRFDLVHSSRLRSIKKFHSLCICTREWGNLNRKNPTKTTAPFSLLPCPFQSGQLSHPNLFPVKILVTTVKTTAPLVCFIGRGNWRRLLDQANSTALLA